MDDQTINDKFTQMESEIAALQAQVTAQAASVGGIESDLGKNPCPNCNQRAAAYFVGVDNKNHWRCSACGASGDR